MWRSILIAYPVTVAVIATAVPLLAPHNWITGNIQPMYRAARLGCRLLLALSGVNVRFLHLERAFAHPCCVFVGNHRSGVEAPALFMVLPRIVVILKKSLGYVPLLGHAMARGGFITVDRDVKGSRRNALERATEALKSGLSLLVFPEGTRGTSDTLLPFRPGPFQMAIAAGVPVVPITIYGAADRLPKGTMLIRPGPLTIEFHPPVQTKNLEPSDRLDLMDKVRSIMQEAIDRNAA